MEMMDMDDGDGERGRTLGLINCSWTHGIQATNYISFNTIYIYIPQGKIMYCRRCKAWVFLVEEAIQIVA